MRKSIAQVFSARLMRFAITLLLPSLCPQILQTNNVDPYHIYSEFEIRPIVEKRIYSTREELQPMEKVLREAMYISNELSMPDLTYITACGEIVCIEVETKSYSQAKLKAKRKVAEILRAKYIPIRI